MKEDESISWSTPEYDKKDHTVDWYWTVGLVTLVAIALCIYFKDFLFGFLLFIGIGTLTFLSTRDPQTIDITITYKGLKVRDQEYPWRNLKAFWVEERPQHNGKTHLLLITDRMYVPMIALPIGDIDPEILRKALTPHMKEEELQENPSHTFLEMLGF
jgi:hypothetical protein